MTGLTTDLLSSACRIFLSLAYPAGEETVPEKRRLFAHLPPGQDVADYHARQPFAPASFQVIHDPDGIVRGYAIRLGSAPFPHLKLKVQWKSDRGRDMWIFAVDTHDAFSRDSKRPPPDHPDAEGWSRLQRTNAELKSRIERAWDEAGLLTFNGLLRRELSGEW